MGKCCKIKEVIGGEFSVSLDGKSYTLNKKARGYYYASGRTSLSVILEAVKESRGAEKITICAPDYVCGSVINTIKDSGTKILFFRVGVDMLPSDDLYEIVPVSDALLLVNYFGLVDLDPIIAKIKKLNDSIVIIIDDVMNYYGFGEYTGYDYSFNSFRKWFPVPDGAEIKCKHQESIRKTFDVENTFYKYKLAGNILKNYQELVGIDLCLELLDKGEELLDREHMASGSGFTETVMETINKNSASLRRKSNASILHEGLTDMGIEHLYDQESTPLFVPIILKRNRDKIRKLFFENNVFCPIHWPSAWQDDFSGLELNPLYEWELSLICDQRYGESEMLKQLEILKHAV